jgi:hypothetical protein
MTFYNKYIKYKSKYLKNFQYGGNTTNYHPPLLDPNEFINEIMEGKDKNDDENDYISKKDKDGIYKWFKIIKGKTPKEYYQQFPKYIEEKYDTSFFFNNLKNFQKDLDKIGVTFYFIKWGIYNPTTTYADFKCEIDLTPDFILYSENNLFIDSCNNDSMYIQHDISEKKWKNVNKILKKYFPKKTIGITSNKDAIKIFFEEQKNIKKNQKKVSFDLEISFIDEIVDKKIILNDLLKIDSIIQKNNIGYLNNVYIILGKHTHLDFNINFNKIKKFEEIIEKIKKNYYGLSKIEKIEYDIDDTES